MAEFGFTIKDGSPDEIAKLNKTLNWLMNNLDHDNITRIYTEYCNIQSELGETVIDGPLIKMTAGTTTLRLKMGKEGADFVFKLYNVAGAETISLNSTGNIIASNMTAVNITALDNLLVKQASAVKASITIGDGLGGVTPATITYSGTDVPVSDVNLTLTSVSNITLQASASGYVRVLGGVFQAPAINSLGNIDASGYTVTAAKFSGNATGVDALGANAVLKCSNGNYALLNSSYMQVVLGGATKHQFNADGTKVGGTIEIDGKNWGMSPVDSPKILISDLILGQKITPKGTIVVLDDKLSKAINGYAVFPSRSDVVISDKQKDSFCVSGNGEVDLYIIGKRVGQEDVNWVEMVNPEVI